MTKIADDAVPLHHRATEAPPARRSAASPGGSRPLSPRSSGAPFVSGGRPQLESDRSSLRGAPPRGEASGTSPPPARGWALPRDRDAPREPGARAHPSLRVRPRPPLAATLGQSPPPASPHPIPTPCGSRSAVLPPTPLRRHRPWGLRRAVRPERCRPSSGALDAALRTLVQRFGSWARAGRETADGHDDGVVHGRGDDDEADEGADEVAVPERGVAHGERQRREIALTTDGCQRRRQQVLDEGRHHGSERCADDDRDG